MAVLCNNVIAGASIADDAAGGVYQIEKSLRFNSADSAYLSRTFGLGNRRTFTWAGWVKRNKLGATQSLFNCHPSSNDKAYFHLHSEDKLGHNSYHSSTWWNGSTERSPELLRDPSAWMHVVFVMDTTNSEPDDRYRYYVNGKRLTHPGGDYGLNILNTLNTAVQHNIGGNYNDSNYGDFYLADVQFIDGLALSPAAFGEFASDGSGVWNPKAFALPTPNTTAGSPTWSGSGFSGDAINSSYPATKMFDGASDTQLRSNGTEATIHWAPSGGIKYNQSVRVNSYFSGNILVNDGDENIALSGSALTWHTVAAGSGTLDKLTFTSASGNVIWVSQIEVDGVILVDGQTDVATRNNVNDGRTWDSTVADGFNGNPGDNYLTTSTDTITVNFSPGISYNELRFASASGAGGTTADMQYSINGGTLTNFIGGSLEKAVYASGSNTLTSFAIKNTSATNCRWNYLKVDGHHLINGAVDNSFHFKFNDTSSNAALGYDSLGTDFTESHVEKGGPILKTNIAGDTVTSGSNTDANSSNLVFAWPGNNLTTDVSSSPHTLTNNGTVTSNTTDAKFYGSCGDFGAASDQKYISAPESADFDFGTGSWTIETWIRRDSDTANANNIMGVWQFQGDGAGDNNEEWLALLWYDNTKKYTFYYGQDGAGNGNHTNVVLPDLDSSDTKINTWHHFAVSFKHDDTSNGTLRLFINGNVVASVSDSTTNSSSGTKQNGWGGSNKDLHLGIQEWNRNFAGQLQDFRIYKGVSKYNANFTVPTRNDFTVNNLTEAISTSSTSDVLEWDGGDLGLSNPAGGSGNAGGYKNMYTTIPDDGWEYEWVLHNETDGNTGWFFDDSTSVSGTHPNQQGGNSFGLRNNGGGSAQQSGTFGSSTVSMPSDAMDGDPDWYFTLDRATQTGTVKAGSSGTSYSYTVPSGTLYFHVNAYGSYNYKIESSAKNSTPTAADVDSLVDSPTNYGTDAGAGGEVRGNYCTLNPLDTEGTVTLSQGNLKAVVNAGASNAVYGTFAPKTGLWYCEITLNSSAGGDNDAMIGVVDISASNRKWTGAATDAIYYYQNGQKYIASSGASYGSSYTDGDIIGIAIDATNGAAYFAKNNTWQASGVPTSGSSKTNAAWTWTAGSKHVTIGLGSGDGALTYTLNPGSRPFKYTAPTDYKALCTQNLPDTFSGEAAGTVNNPSKYFDVLTYTGTGTTQDIKGLAFEPDFTWVKSRSNAVSGMIFDQIRTNGSDQAEYIFPDLTNASAGPAADVHNAWLTDGYQLGGNTHSNNDGYTYVGWNWDAGTATSASTNNSGSNNATITCDYLVNPTAGFSIAKYSGTDDGSGTNNIEYVYHGLTTAPDFVIIKNLSSAKDWITKHKGNSTNKNNIFNLTNAQDTWGDGYIGDLDVTNANNIVQLKQNSSDTPNNIMGSGNDYIMYSWTAIPGYSAFGTFEGNDDVDGPFIYCGFRPRFFMAKNIDAAYSWYIFDTERSTYNWSDKALYPDLNAAETTSGAGDAFDIVSNGVKLRGDGSNTINASDNTYIYAAFAENPFKTARAR